MKPLGNKKMLALCVVLIACVMAGLYKGAVDIPLTAFFSGDNRIIVQMRLMRVIMAIVCGAGLSTAGIIVQAILRNNLAEPYLLGTSSGAGLGAVAVIASGVSAAFLAPAAFCGALLSMALVYAIARQGTRVSEHTLILSGVIVSMALSALIVFIVSISRNDALYGITWWLWGSLQVFDVRLLAIVSGIVAVVLAVVYIFCQDLNAISIGEEDAVHLGINIEAMKKLLLACAALLTASLVCICGIIGFVGLIVPHAARLIVGPNHRRLIPAACVLSASFMIVCDLISRTAFAPVELPIGVITALAGGPLFIVLLKRRQGSRWN